MSAKELYLSTFSNGPDHQKLQAFLQSHLDSLSPQHLDLPEVYNHTELEAYLNAKYQSVLTRYNEYLQRRANGGPRELFPDKATAFYYIECVSPTKLVDGSWLYSVFKRRDLNVYAILQKIYIEELGEGQAHMNHVYIYKALLEQYKLNQDLTKYGDDLFIHGAIQLAFGYSSESMLPEIVGYNVGYEQLPYDLLVITYELDELGIDPYYFSLHVTADNSSTGHAKNATDAVLELLDRCPDEQSKAKMYQRVRRGYALNDVNPSSVDIIKRFSSIRQSQDYSEQSQPASAVPDNVAIEALMDKYLGKSLTQHKFVQLPDPDTGDYKLLPDIYTNNRQKLLKSFDRYSVRRATADSFCWGRMKKVMPESDKQLLLQWLAVYDHKALNRSHTQHNNTLPAGTDKLASSMHINSHQQLVVYLNTLLYVISKYLDPREHYSESGIVMTLMYHTISRHTPLGSVDNNIEKLLQPLSYWTLLGVCMHTLQSTFLNNTCNVDTLLEMRIKSEEDKQRSVKVITYASKNIKFEVPGQQLDKKNCSSSALFVSNKSRISAAMPRGCQKLMGLILSIVASFVVLSVVEVNVQ